MTGVRGKICPEQIKIKIKDIDYHLNKLKRRIQLSGWTDDFQNLKGTDALNTMLAELFNAPKSQQDWVKHSDLSCLLIALNQVESHYPSDREDSTGQFLDVLMQADLMPRGESFDFLVPPWASLSDIAVKLASIMRLPVDQIEKSLLNGMGELGGRQFSLYPTAVELLRNELIRCENCLLGQEMHILNVHPQNNLSSQGQQQMQHNSKQPSTFSLPYVPSMLGNPEEEFLRADEDGDGYISRVEWRKWMHDKEALIRVHNIDKAQLIKVSLFFLLSSYRMSIHY